MHSGHTVSESSLNDCTCSKRWSHSVQAYWYVGTAVNLRASPSAQVYWHSSYTSANAMMRQRHALGKHRIRHRGRRRTSAPGVTTALIGTSCSSPGSSSTTSPSRTTATSVASGARSGSERS